jgi:hypothetical protein
LDPNGNVAIASALTASGMTTIGSASSPTSPGPSTLNVVTAIANDGIFLQGTGSTPTQSLWLRTNVGGLAGNGITAAGDGQIVYGGSSQGPPNGGLVIAPWLGSAMTSGLRLDPNGNVFIPSALTTIGSTVVPVGPGPSKLNVVTTANDDGIYLTGGSTQNLWFGTNATSRNNQIVQAGDREIIYGGHTAGHPGGGLVLAPWDTVTSGIRLGSDGHVGIGTPTPSVHLDVNGVIAANGSYPIANNLPPSTLLTTNLGWKIGLYGQAFAIGVADATMALLVGSKGFVSVFDGNNLPNNDATPPPSPSPDSHAAVSLGSNGNGYFSGSVGIGIGNATPSAALAIAGGGQFKIGNTLIADVNGSYYAS